jgi:pimeloyl-ACP methyl ester carboxylesterase
MPLPRRLPGPAVTRAAHVIYLHGFASSPESTKAEYLAQRLSEHGIRLVRPDLNAPDFRTMTMTRMLGQIERLLRESGANQAALIGSSLGGTLAILAASRYGASIDRVALLAPAVMFAKPGHHLLPPERVAEWRRAGALPFYHYGTGAERLLDVGFYEDSLQYDPFHATFTQPALVFQGLRDTSVDARTVEAFARTRPNVTLSLLDDDHQLTASLPRIWDGLQPFLGLVE